MIEGTPCQGKLIVMGKGGWSADAPARTRLQSRLHNFNERGLSCEAINRDIEGRSVAPMRSVSQVLSRPGRTKNLANREGKAGFFIMEREYGRPFALVRECLDKFFPLVAEEGKRDFVRTFFPEMFGIYAYAVVTDKQQSSIFDAGVNYLYQTASSSFAIAPVGCSTARMALVRWLRTKTRKCGLFSSSHDSADARTVRWSTASASRLRF